MKNQHVFLFLKLDFKEKSTIKKKVSQNMISY